jgi:hypothetical protein
VTSEGINTGKRFIHYDPDRTDFAVSEDELHQLQNAGSNLWKDTCLVLGSLGIPSIINALHDTPDPFVLSVSLFLNYVVGILGIVLSLVFAVAWYRSSRNVQAVIDKIMAKPRHELPLTATNVGALSSEPDKFAQ